MTRKPRIPEVLWRLFQNRARTLSATIISLLSPSPADAASLLRPDDSSDYRDLLSRCFAVVSENAPPLPLFSPHEFQWSQHQIVERTIEMIISEKSASSNVICSGYDKCNQSSPLVELLSGPAWCLLLERVGEGIMAHLLKHASIFMPLDHKKYHQVAGTPITKLCFAMSKHMPKSQRPSYLLIPSGPKKKRERDDAIVPVSKRNHVASSISSDGVSSSFTCFSSHHEDKQCQMNLSVAALEIKESSVKNTKDNSNQEVQQNSNQSIPKLRKRSRPYSWQRHRKRRQLDSQDTVVITSSTSIPIQKNMLSEKRGLKGNSGSSFLTGKRAFRVVHTDILNSLKPNSSDSMFLLESIFGLSDVVEHSDTVAGFENNGFCLSDSASVCLFHSLIKNLKILIRRTRSCQHLRLLNKHCTVLTLDRNATGNSECSHKGSEFENQLLKKSQDCFSNQSKSSLEANHLEAIKSYCPKKSERGKRDVFYYKKSVWEMVKRRAATCLKNQNYVCLDNAATREIVSCRTFGFSKLRLLPKENGIRLLANLKASSRTLQESYGKNEFSGTHKRTDWVKKSVEFKYFRSVNSVLRDTHAVLKGMQLKEPEKLGSSVFDYNDVYRRLCPFLIGLKRGSSTMRGVFMIVSDVSKAFDSVDQNKLLSVIKDVISEERYTLKQSCQVFCTKKSLSVREDLALLDQNINSRNASFIPLRSPDSILVNQECSRSVKKEELLFNLDEHVKRNVLQLDKKFYLQRVGISQGSVLSSLLCSLYYGDMDRKVIFPFLERTSQRPIQDVLKKCDCENASSAQFSDNKVTSSIDYMLLRFIDDFLFISTSKQQAKHFFSRLSRGFRDYNCYMNEGKFGVNFDIGRISELSSNRLSVGEDGTSFLRWSGLLINCSTLEVQADYTKYLSDHLCSSLTVCWQGKPARHLEAKLCGYMRPKCHPIFYDSNINSAGVVRLNIFQAFLLCAMKFHCYFCDLSYICKFQTRSYLRIIEKSFRYMHFLIKKRMCSASLGFGLHPILHLEDGEVEWLGLNAYIQVLKKKQSRHKELLSLLTSKLSAHNLSGTRSTHLNYAIDASHSSLMWKIKY
ncbi:Telomerase reverse transcriptase [Morus notabilis]|uniref:Telomerase reverse transcriptase n=1 Tax=Morus notabilis TaxID=981085 RepID=W9RWW1_9ROSA|nr:Telomerase reverse transcriptase [Morus notabilis]